MNEIREEISSMRVPSMTIDDLNHKIVNSIRLFLETKCNIVGVVAKKLSEDTEVLMERRREMNREGMRGTEAYRDLNRLINRKCRADLRRYNVEQTGKIDREEQEHEGLGDELADS